MQISCLTRILRLFKASRFHGSFSYGPWRIANGGYDLWFEIYYRGMPVVQCIAGEISWCGKASTLDSEILSMVHMEMCL